MNPLRYPEKKHLTKYDLSLEFFDELGLKVIDVVPLRKVFILKTESGNKILKLIELKNERIEFIETCIKIVSKNYKNIIKFTTFSDGKSYKGWKGNVYVLMDLLEGREVAFSNIIEYRMCGEALAKMHLASKEGLNEVEVSNLLDDSLSVKFQNDLNNIHDIKDLVSKFKYLNEFDELFIQNVDRAIDEMERAKELIDFGSYNLYRSDRNNISVCHNDLASHNFLIKDEEIYLIDFDYCSIDLRVMDVADIVLKGIKNAAFDFEKAIEVLDTYSSVYKLNSQDYKIIYILLLYPRDFYSIVKAYYFKEKEWEYEVFIDRLKNKIIKDDFRKDFLEYYKHYLSL